MRLSCPSILPCSVARPTHCHAQMPPLSTGFGDWGLGKQQGMILCQSTHPAGAGLEHGPTWHPLLSRTEGTETPGTVPGLGDKEESWQRQSWDARMGRTWVSRGGGGIKQQPQLRLPGERKGQAVARRFSFWHFNDRNR